jgi:hypothetical protein
LIHVNDLLSSDTLKCVRRSAFLRKFTAFSRLFSRRRLIPGNMPDHLFARISPLMFLPAIVGAQAPGLPKSANTAVRRMCAALEVNRVPPITPPPITPPGKPRGRPKGSSNKPKAIDREPEIKPAAMRIKRAANYMGGHSETTIRRLADQGELEKRYVGTTLVIMTRSIDAYLERCSQSVATAIRKKSKRERSAAL